MNLIMLFIRKLLMHVFSSTCVSLLLIICWHWLAIQVLAHSVALSACTVIHLAHLKMKAQSNTAILERGIQFMIATGAVLMQM